MKLHIFKLAKVAVFGLVLLASAPGRAYFNGGNSGIPNPQSGSWLGDSSRYWGTVGGVYSQWGWTFARYSGPTEIFAQYWDKGTKIDNTEVLVDGYTGSGGTRISYKLEEYYWDGAVYKAGQSRVQGVAGYTGYASGDVW